MVPYQSTSSARTSLTMIIGACDDSTTVVDNQTNNRFVITLTRIPEEEDLSLLLQREKPTFDRVMKMRNTDGRPVQYSTWKPVRMLCGRDNIGTRNFRKVN